MSLSTLIVLTSMLVDSLNINRLGESFAIFTMLTNSFAVLGISKPYSSLITIVRVISSLTVSITFSIFIVYYPYYQTFVYSLNTRACDTQQLFLYCYQLISGIP